MVDYAASGCRSHFSNLISPLIPPKIPGIQLSPTADMIKWYQKMFSGGSGPAGAAGSSDLRPGAGEVEELSAKLGDVRERIEAENDHQRIGELYREMTGLLEKITIAATPQPPSLIEKYRFEIFETALGTGYRFTQPKLVPLAQIATEINEAAQKLLGRDAICQGHFRAEDLFNDKGMRSVSKRDLVHECIPLVSGSNRLAVGEQAVLLKSSKLTGIERPVLTICAGLQRLNMGDPADRADIGKPADEGDIFKGLASRGSPGAIKTYLRGVDCCNNHKGRAHEILFVAGVPVAKSKDK